MLPKLMTVNWICVIIVVQHSGLGQATDLSSGDALEPCGQAEFPCANGDCVPNMFVCDGDADCEDNLDEENCTGVQYSGLGQPTYLSSGDALEQCDQAEFPCTDGDCIPNMFVCDGDADCDDNSDEESCTVLCGVGEFRCNDGECIDATWRCDETDDCDDASDELGCKDCDGGMFECDNGECIYQDWVCDSEDDCVDASDEIRCQPVNTSDVGTTTGPDTICQEERWRCDDGMCVLLSWRCDGYMDCLDDSDEANCTSEPNPCDSHTCHHGGTCVVDGDDDDPYCVCPQHVYGLLCDTDLRGCTDQVNDVLILIDSNSYIDQGTLESMARVAAKFVSFLNISEHATRVSVVNFRREKGWYLKCSLNSYFDPAILEYVIRFSAVNNTGFLKFRQQNRLGIFDASHGGRESVNDVIVVFSSKEILDKGGMAIPHHPLAQANIMTYYIGVESRDHVIDAARFEELTQKNTWLVNESDSKAVERVAMRMRKEACDTVKQGVCYLNPCMRNGTCVGLSQSFYCLCPYGFTGHYCEYDMMECPHAYGDVIIALDVTNITVKQDEHQTLKDVAWQLTGLMNVEENLTRVGFLHFHRDLGWRKLLDLKDCINKRRFRAEIESSDVPSSFVSGELQSLFQPAYGDRIAARDTIVVVTTSDDPLVNGSTEFPLKDFSDAGGLVEIIQLVSTNKVKVHDFKEDGRWLVDVSDDRAKLTQLANEILFAACEFRASGSLPTCQQGQWQCAEGTCVMGTWRCDGFRDCPDGSDETNCTTDPSACDSHPCAADGTCILDTTGQVPTCLCPHNVYGRNCQTDLRECTTQVNDVLLLVDDNPYISESESSLLNNAAAKLATNLDISENGTHVAVVNFGQDGWHLKCRLDGYFDQTILEHVIRFKEVNKSAFVEFQPTNKLQIFDSNYGGREAINDVIILFSTKENLARDNVMLPYHPLAQANILTYYVGLESPQYTIDIAQLNELADRNVLFVQSSDAATIKDVALTIRKHACDNVKRGLCELEPCLNNGTCIPMPQSFQCLCQYGFIGHYCEYDMTKCSRPYSDILFLFESDPRPKHTEQFEMMKSVIKQTTRLVKLGNNSTRISVVNYDRELGWQLKISFEECSQASRCMMRVESLVENQNGFSSYEDLPDLFGFSNGARTTAKDFVIVVASDLGILSQNWTSLLPYHPLLESRMSAQRIAVTSARDIQYAGSYSNSSWLAVRYKLDPVLQMANDMQRQACEYSPDACGDQPCLNNGTCQSEDRYFVCVCADNFSGIYCEKRMTIVGNVDGIESVWSGLHNNSPYTASRTTGHVTTPGRTSRASTATESPRPQQVSTARTTSGTDVRTSRASLETTLREHLFPSSTTVVPFVESSQVHVVITEHVSTGRNRSESLPTIMSGINSISPGESSSDYDSVSRHLSPRTEQSSNLGMWAVTEPATTTTPAASTRYDSTRRQEHGVTLTPPIEIPPIDLERQTDACDLMCQNDGKCVQMGAGWTCACQRGANGPLCQNFSCEWKKIGMVSSKEDRLSSRCTSVHVIERPELTVDECRQSTCRLHGNTFNHRPGECHIKRCFGSDLKLSDSRGPYDVYTTMVSNPCVDQYCNHGGTCQSVSSSGNGYDVMYEPICHCKPGYTGRLCEKVDSPYKTNLEFQIETTFTDDLLDPTSLAYADLSEKIIFQFRVSFGKLYGRHYATSVNFHLTFSRGSVIVHLTIGLPRPASTSALSHVLTPAVRQLGAEMGVTTRVLRLSIQDYAFNCGFEDGMCGCSQSSPVADFAWHRHVGPSVIPGTGPHSAFQGNYYISIDGAQQSYGDKAILELSSINSYTGTVCLSFHYHVHGANVGELSLHKSTGSNALSESSVIWREWGSSDNSWQEAVLAVNVSQISRLSLVAVAGDGPKSTIAVDSMKLTLDMSRCEALQDSRCPKQAMGPHPTACMLELWGEYCLPTGSGNPLINRDTRAVANLGTLRAFRQTVQRTAARGNGGSREDLMACYGASEHYIRLVDGKLTSGTRRGRVEVYQAGSWATVCDDDFDEADALVICRQLGFQRGQPRTAGFLGEGSGPIALSNLACQGHEDGMYSCPHSDRGGDWHCSHSEDAGVICSEDFGNQIKIGAEHIIYRSHMDDTSNVVFLPDVSRAVKEEGILRSWNAYSEAVTAVPVHLQMWRRYDTRTDYSRRTETYQLMFEMGVQLKPGGNNYEVELPESELLKYASIINEKNRVLVQKGSIFGFYSQGSNPIPYSPRDCYSMEEPSRYITGMDQAPALGQTYEFHIAPMTSNPCRDYSFNVVMDILPTDVLDNSPPSVGPSPWASGAIFSCGFEENLCGMTQGVSDELDWARHSGRTPTEATGPAGAHQGSEYIYVKAIGHSMADRARISSPSTAHNGSGCLMFHYSMVGVGVHRLDVIQEEAHGNSQSDDPVTLINVWMQQGPVAGDWRLANIDVHCSGLVRYHFDGTVGHSAFGDIAIDALALHRGTCASNAIYNIRPVTLPQQVATVTQDTTKIVYVSKEGTNKLPCGSFQDPCASLSIAMEHDGQKKMLIVKDTFEGHMYDLDLSEFGRTTYELEVSSLSHPGRLEAIGNRNSVRLVNLGLTTLRRNQTHKLTFRGLAVRGNLEIICYNTDLLLVMHDCKVESDLSEVFRIRGCPRLKVQIWNTEFSRIFIHIISNFSTNLHFHNVAIVGSTDLHTLGAGLFVQTAGLHSQHIIRVINCTFSQTGYRHQDGIPYGALAIESLAMFTQLKLFVTKCSFLSNRRAISVGIKGKTIMHVSNCIFDNNTSPGPGGAIKIAPAMLTGLMSPNDVAETRINIMNCTFDGNSALNTHSSDSPGLQGTSSPGSGGALYADVGSGSGLKHDNLLEVDHCTFTSNTADAQGGAIFIGPGIRSTLLNNVMKSSRPTTSTIGALIYASNRLAIEDALMVVGSAEENAAILFYEAAEPLDNTLEITGFRLVCPAGYAVDHLLNSNTGSSIQTLQIYCRPCPEHSYSINNSTMTMSGIDMEFFPNILCNDCPYGARCYQGIQNRPEFWGQSCSDGAVVMHPCPIGYCNNTMRASVAYAQCAANRIGTLCGQCREGFSEALFSTTCVPNMWCGGKQWIVVAFVALYGLAYVLFFMLQSDWSRYMAKMFNCCQKKPFLQRETWPGTNDGYFQIFMYFVQTATLLTIRARSDPETSHSQITKPDQTLPRFMLNGVEGVFSYDFPLLYTDACPLPSMTPLRKILAKLGFMIYLYGFLFVTYVVSGCGCICARPSKRPQCGGLRFDSRIFVTLVALLIYTYQEVAHLAFQLLNCRTIAGESVLFVDGNVLCIQDWQYAVIFFVAVHVAPLFVSLLFGPKLLQAKSISLRLLITSWILPLIISPVFIYRFCKKQRRRLPSYKTQQIRALSAISNQEFKTSHTVEEQLQETGEKTKENPLCVFSIQPPSEKNDELHNKTLSDTIAKSVTVDSDSVRSDSGDEINSALVEVLSGPYTDNFLHGLCYEGVFVFRRLTMIAIFVFVADRMLKHILMAVACLVFLAVHFKVKPFRNSTASSVEAISLTTLLIFSGANLVRAVFILSGTMPVGSMYVVLVLSEWLEVICFSILPIVIIGSTFLMMTYRGLRSCLCQKSCKCKMRKHKPSIEMSSKDSGSGILNPYQPRTPPYQSHINSNQDDRDANNNVSNLQRIFSPLYRAVEHDRRRSRLPGGRESIPKRGLARAYELSTPGYETYTPAKRRWFPTYLSENRYPEPSSETRLIPRSRLGGPFRNRLDLHDSPMAMYVPALDQPHSATRSPTVGSFV